MTCAAHEVARPGSRDELISESIVTLEARVPRERLAFAADQLNSSRLFRARPMREQA